MRRFGLVLGAALMGACLAAMAQSAPDTFSLSELKALEAEKLAAEQQLAALEAAETSAELDVVELNASLLTAAAESRRREEQATDAERKLIDLEIRRKNATQRLFADEDALESLLAALASASRSRPPALVVSADKANQAVRSAILMGDAAPELAARAEALGLEITALNRLERGIRQEKARLEAAEATLALKKLEIERFALAKRAKYENVSADAARLRDRAAKLAVEAEGLRELLLALEADAPAVPGRKPAIPTEVALKPKNSTNTAARTRPAQDLSGLRPLGAKEIGAMVQPVAGAVSVPFGKRRPTGSRSEGITFVTRQDAQVVAPVDGVIEFSDTFRSYGHMLILRTSDNYRVIMTGLGDTFGARGQSVTAGEPVGRMSARRNPAPELYLELRKNDRSENPAGWLER